MSKKLLALFLLLTLTACTTNYSPITMNEVEKELGIKFDFPLVWLHSTYDYWQEKTVRVKFSTDEQGLKKFLGKFDPNLDFHKISYPTRERINLDEGEWKPSEDKPLKFVSFQEEKIVNGNRLLGVEIYFKQLGDKVNVYVVYGLDGL